MLRHARTSTPVPSGGHALTLRDLLAKNDVFALGHALYSCLLEPSDMARFPDLNNPYREWDIPELPSWISRGAKQFMQRLVACDPARRPSVRYVAAAASCVSRWRQCCTLSLPPSLPPIVACREAYDDAQMLLWGSRGGSTPIQAVRSVDDARRWLRQRRLELGFTVDGIDSTVERTMYEEFLLRMSPEAVCEFATRGPGGSHVGISGAGPPPPMVPKKS